MEENTDDGGENLRAEVSDKVWTVCVAPVRNPNLDRSINPGPRFHSYGEKCAK